MASRLQRHLVSKKTLRWHIDYLLAADPVHIIQIHLAEMKECYVNQLLKGSIPVKGFGSGDCRDGCKSHLKYIRQL